MFRIASTTAQNRTPQLPHASRNTNPHMSKSSGVIHSTSVSRPQLKSYQVKEKVMPNISQVKVYKEELNTIIRISSISKKTKSLTGVLYNSSYSLLTLDAQTNWKFDTAVNASVGLVPQGQKASDYDNSDPVPPRQNVVPTAEKTDSSHQGLEFLFSPLLEEYYNPTHDQAEENNNDQAPNASFQEAEFVNPFCTRVQEIGESSSRNIDNTDVHSFQPQSHDFDGQRYPLNITLRRAMADLQGLKQCKIDLHKFDRNKRSGNWPSILGKALLEGYSSLVDKLVSWMSKKQNCTAMSSAEAEYVGYLQVVLKYCGLRTQLQRLWLQLKQSTVVITEYQLADMFTKALPEDRFKYLVRRIGMRCLTPAELEVLTNESA
ncbi:hypothetical protein Tco_0145579 [Tanacetum coccineum]